MSRILGKKCQECQKKKALLSGHPVTAEFQEEEKVGDFSLSYWHGFSFMKQNCKGNIRRAILCRPFLHYFNLQEGQLLVL